jgi:hypothetical protein
VAVLLVALVWGALEVAQQTHTFNWIQHAPVKWLLYEAQNGGAPSQSDAVKELLDRVKNSTLNPGQVAATVAVALTMQGDSSKPWDPAWGDIIEIERGNQHVSDEQWRQYAHQAMQGALGFRVRPAVRMGDPLPYWIDEKKGRTATNTRLRFMYSSTSLCFDSSSDNSNGGISTGPNSFTGGSAAGSEVNPGLAFKGLSPGNHVLHFHGKLSVGEPQGVDDVTHVVFEDMDLSGPVALMSSTRPTVRAVANPSLAEAIRKGLRPDLQMKSKVHPWESAGISVDNAPVGLSFKVYGVAGGKEVEIGSFACPAGTQNHSWGFGSDHPLAQLLSTTPPTTASSVPGPHVTIVLRADPEPAIHSTDVTDYWDGTIELKDVPVQE